MVRSILLALVLGNVLVTGCVLKALKKEQAEAAEYMISKIDFGKFDDDVKAGNIFKLTKFKKSKDFYFNDNDEWVRSARLDNQGQIKDGGKK